jgi:hypothetical protein
LEERFTSLDQAIRSKDVELLRRFYHLNYIVKSNDIPDSYFNTQTRIFRERGYGNETITADRRKEAILNIKANQKESLDTWIDYLLSSDADQYPIWVRYWSFEGMLKLGVFNEETGKFSKRTSSTVAPFIDLNHEAYAGVVDALIRRINGDSLDDLTDEVFNHLVQSGATFGALYGKLFKSLKEGGGVGLRNETRGVWKKYAMGSSPDNLVESLKGKGTGWCTAGRSTAEKQLLE